MMKYAMYPTHGRGFCNMLDVSTAEQYRFTRFLPWVILFVFLAFTYHLWKIERNENVQRLQYDFNFSVQEGTERIKQRLLAYEQVLRSAQGLFAASGKVSRDQFHAYVVELHLEENYPGIQGVGFSLIVPPEQKDKHIAAVRTEITRSDIPPYTIKPEGNRSIYTSVIYLEPFSGSNLRAFGYDMFSDPVRRSAMEQARDSGKASNSGKVILLQEAGKDVQSGFLMYLPVYKNDMPHNTVAERRANIIGWLYAPFRMGDLMQGIPGVHAGELDYKVYDGDQVLDQHLMYDTDINPPANANFSAKELINLAGHDWTFYISSTPSFEARLDAHSTSLIAKSGIGGSLLLALLSWLLLSGRKRAYQLARELNRELIHSQTALQQSEARLRVMLENEVVGILTVKERVIQWANPAYEKLLGYEKGELSGVPVRRIYVDEEAYRALGKAAYPVFNAGGVYRTELEYLCKDGSHKNVDVSGGILNRDTGESIWTCVDISERKLMEELIHDERNFVNAILNTAGALIVVINRDGAIKRFNRAAEQFTGYSLEEVKDRPFFWDKFLPPEQRKGVRTVFDGIKSGKVTPYYENYWIDREGQACLFAWTNTLLTDDENQMEYVIAIGTDITERIKAESEIRIAAIAFESQEGMGITDTAGKILRVNRAFTRITGYSAEEAIGRGMNILKSGRHDASFYAAMWESISRTGSWEGEIWNRRKCGEIYPEYLTITRVKDTDGTVTHYVANMTDITLTKAAADEIKSLAFYDPLTLLPNRRLLSDRLHQALSSIMRSGRSGALLFIDLDNFKALNDALGHDIGDLLLQQVAKRLGLCVREGDTVARLGGDEFVVMLEDLSKDLIDAAEQTKSVGNKILSTLNEPYQLAGHTYSNTPSIGATLFNNNLLTTDELLKQADIAMYQSKKAGRNRMYFFDPNMQRIVS